MAPPPWIPLSAPVCSIWFGRLIPYGDLDDPTDVGSLVSRVRNAITGPGRPSTQVRALLHEAHAARTRVDLEPLHAIGSTPRLLVTAIEEVREHAVIIGQPVVGGLVRPLARYEPYRMSFVCGAGRVVGLTHSLGRIRIPAGGDGALCGYRLALPRSLSTGDGDEEGSSGFCGGEVHEAQLLVPTHVGPIHGLLEDITPRGVRVRCRNARDHIKNGQVATFRVELPRPVGLINTTITVLGTRREADTGEITVRGAFDEPIDRIAELFPSRRRHRV